MAEMTDKSCIADIGCPFYHRHTYSNQIVCDGVCEGSTNGIHFVNRKTRNWYLHHYCCSVWEECPIFQMLDDGYKEENS